MGAAGAMKKGIAEFIGTFTLVFFGCGAAVIAGMGTGPTSIDVLGIAFAFGLAIVAMAYGIGSISGCHVNPAVSFGVLVAGRMQKDEFIRYVIAQVLGAIAGALVALHHSRWQALRLVGRIGPERLGHRLSRRIQLVLGLCV